MQACPPVYKLSKYAKHLFVCHESSMCLHNCISWKEVKFAAAAPNNSSPALRPGEATGSWWSGSAKHPNWHRQSAAAESQRSQMPPSTCHVFQEGQEGENEALAKTFSSGANLTHVFGTPLDFCSPLTLWIFQKVGASLFSQYSANPGPTKWGPGAHCRTCYLLTRWLRRYRTGGQPLHLCVKYMLTGLPSACRLSTGHPLLSKPVRLLMSGYVWRAAGISKFIPSACWDPSLVLLIRKSLNSSWKKKDVFRNDHVQYKAPIINDPLKAFRSLRRVFSLPALSVVVYGSFVDDTTSQAGGEILRQSFQFAGTCHPYLPRRGLGKWELFEWVPCLNNSYLRPATASWWLSVPVLWADAKTSWHDEAWVRTVWWQNTRLDVNTHQLQSICLSASSSFS